MLRSKSIYRQRWVRDCGKPFDFSLSRAREWLTGVQFVSRHHVESPGLIAPLWFQHDHLTSTQCSLSKYPSGEMAKRQSLAKRSLVSLLAGITMLQNGRKGPGCSCVHARMVHGPYELAPLPGSAGRRVSVHVMSVASEGDSQ